ncbi:MAG: hypothetical protein MZV70_73090 [Desulfobacterales bacterium]|nr:hypothetical protein [Desulfobacterales bacterium]
MTHIEDIIDDALIKTFGSGKFSGVAYEVNVPPGPRRDLCGPRFSGGGLLAPLRERLRIHGRARARLTVNVSLHPHYLIVDVIDTGKGIPSDEIKDIFNPFYTCKVPGCRPRAFKGLHDHRGARGLHHREQLGEPGAQG